MSRPFDILSLGSIYFDINAVQFPFGTGLLPESETVGSAYQACLGGSAVICANVAAAMGVRTVFVGKVGDDEFGVLLAQKLHDSGITPHLLIAPQVQTNVSCNYVDPTGKTLMTVLGSANQSLTKDEIFATLEQILPKVEYLYMGGYFKLKVLTPKFPELISLAKSFGVKLIMDHGRVNNTVTPDELQRLRECVGNVDLYFPSEEEFKAVWNVSSIETGLQKVREITNAIIVVKQGDKGAYGIDSDGTIIHVPAIPVTPLNTVGAGDSFNAGFLSAYTHGASFRECIKTGIATAALKISQKSIPTFEHVHQFMNEYAQK